MTEKCSVIIEIQDLSFRWTPDGPTIVAVDALRIERGEQIFIEGPSGSGKSTLLSLLAGVTTARHGSVRVLDRPLERLGGVERDHFRADHIGYMFQMFNLIPYLSVVDNVVLPCRFSRSPPRRGDGARSEVSSTRRCACWRDLDMADDELLGRPVNRLSVGQQQRVAAARALIGSPELMIADEPTSSLDADRREAFVELLFDECRATAAPRWSSSATTGRWTALFAPHHRPGRASTARTGAPAEA